MRRVDLLGHDIGQVYCACALDMSNDSTCRVRGYGVGNFIAFYTAKR